VDEPEAGATRGAESPAAVAAALEEEDDAFFLLLAPRLLLGLRGESLTRGREEERVRGMMSGRCERGTASELMHAAAIGCCYTVAQWLKSEILLTRSMDTMSV